MREQVVQKITKYNYLHVLNATQKNSVLATFENPFEASTTA